MKIIGGICIFAVIVSAHSAGADVYRYTAQHGNAIYTDDLSNVPEGRRATAVISDDEDFKPPGSADATRTSPAATPNDAPFDLKGEHEKLEALKSELDEEFGILADENARLKAAKKTAVTPDQRKAFNKQVVSFNTRFQAYKEKEAAYRSRLDQYQRRIKAAESNPDN